MNLPTRGLTPQRRSAWFAFASSVVVSVGLWLLFTASGNVHELFLGGVSVVCTIALSAVMYRQETERYDLRWRDVAALWRTPWYLLSGVVEIVWVLGKDLTGERAESIFRVCGFQTAKDDPVLVTRRALAIAYTSIAPNFIVLGIDYHQSRMLFHQIQRSEVPRMTKELGAQVGARANLGTDASPDAVVTKGPLP